MYTRMVIGDQVDLEAFRGIYHSEVLPRLQEVPGFRSASLMIEDGGPTAISLTVWDSRDACLKYHSSMAYREFVKRAHHLLKGDLVVKLFETV